ncbi:hypothetical protein H7J06_15610 [Mycobacterium hodleri]|uniref:hypothetical protein n=1 Tax=Mycolicibacterium hodleri TaxID=49897 RepID=UPI0021F27F23|nr:hypothetical protein [Mycolicibacterium hodleri]MCV7134415.1 hypothetical protein [Mycolicibacterium hodleri]
MPDVVNAALTAVQALANDPEFSAALNLLDPDAQERVLAAIRVVIAPAEETGFWAAVFGGYTDEGGTA